MKPVLSITTNIYLDRIGDMDIVDCRVESDLWHSLGVFPVFKIRVSLQEKIISTDRERKG